MAVKYKLSDFKKDVSKKREQLLKENIQNMNNGSMVKYQFNCNQLIGIEFVMGRLEKTGY